MAMRKIIEIDEDRCNGCGQCVIACAEGALEIIDGKAKVVNEVFCDGLGACIGECPEDALKIIEREAPEFDEEAVKKHLDRKGAESGAEAHANAACGCPSAVPVLLRSGPPTASTASDEAARDEASELVSWPVQWRLISPQAPFLKGADILLAADCAPFAYPDFHRSFMRGKPVVIGCPKLEEQMAFLDKLEIIFREARPRSVSVVMMEVPCCGGLLALAKEAAKRAGVPTDIDSVVIGIDGRVK
ncbi:MAG: 4Fe-4S binding protein [Methanobacteriota archaeon]|nr:MAG: 4Fe-4S binding protein [Euryarchaeota archaeon]